MSQENVKPDQIQASVAAALSRLRGDLAPPSDAPADAPLDRPRTEAPAATPLKPAPMLPRLEPANDLRAEPDFRPVSTGVTSPPATEAQPPVGPELPRAMFSRPRFVPPMTPDPPPLTPTVQRTSGPLSRMIGKVPAEEGARPATQSGAAPTSETAQQDLLAGLPPPPLSGPLVEDQDSNAIRRRRNRRVLALGAALAVIVIGVWIWNLRGGGSQDVPVIAAESTPEKVKPVEEGGLQVPNQNVQVLENMDGSQQAATSETVLPPPEQPVTPPAPAIEETQPAVEEPATGGDATVVPDVPVIAAPEPTVADAPAVSAPEPAQAASTAPDDTASAPATVEAEPAAPAQQSTAQDAAAPEPAAAPAQADAAQSEPAAPAATKEAALAPTPAATGNARIQLAAVKSEDAARQQWTKLQKAYPDLLANLSLTVQSVDKGAEGVFYRIQAGPLADKAAATALCASLKRRGQDCLVAK